MKRLRTQKKAVECLMSVNIMIMDDFNCKNVKWEEWSVKGSEESWGEELIRRAMDNLMTVGG